jgi:hypothetical protein
VPGDQNTSIYRRPDGKLEIGYRDSLGKQRWKVVNGGITAARAERDAILGSKARGDRVRPNPRLRFGEAAARWLAEQVCDLRPSTQACHRARAEPAFTSSAGSRPPAPVLSQSSNSR